MCSAWNLMHFYSEAEEGRLPSLVLSASWEMALANWTNVCKGSISQQSDRGEQTSIWVCLRSLSQQPRGSGQQISSVGQTLSSCVFHCVHKDPRAQGCDNMNDSANNPYSKLQWNGAIIKSKWIVKYCGVVLSLSVCLNSVMASGRQQWPWSHLKYVSHVINVKITVLSQRKHDSSAAKWTFTRCSGKHLRESTRIPRIW